MLHILSLLKTVFFGRPKRYYNLPSEQDNKSSHRIDETIIVELFRYIPYMIMGALAAGILVVIISALRKR